VTWGTTNEMKLAIDDKLAVAQATCDRANRRLCRVAERVSVEILILTGGDRDHTLYQHCFGKRTLRDHKKLALSTKLEIQRGWILSLAQCGQGTLEAIVPEVTDAVAEADDAREHKASVVLEKSQFRDFGAQRQLLEKVNVTCKSVHGELSKLPHQMIGLPNDFADQFFLPERQQRKKPKEEEDPDARTFDAVGAKIERLQKELAASESILDELKAEKLAADKAAEALEKDKLVLAELMSSIEEKKKKLAAELSAKIENS